MNKEFQKHRIFAWLVRDNSCIYLEEEAAAVLVLPVFIANSILIHKSRFQFFLNNQAASKVSTDRKGELFSAKSILLCT